MSLIVTYRIEDEVIATIDRQFAGRVVKVEDTAGTIYRRRQLRKAEVWFGKALTEEAGAGIQFYLEGGVAIVGEG